jgi:hypothetical protein
LTHLTSTASAQISLTWRGARFSAVQRAASAILPAPGGMKQCAPLHETGQAVVDGKVANDAMR